MLSRDEIERKMAEFSGRLDALIQKNPKLHPESPEIVALLKEFREQGVPIQMVNRDDMVKAAMNILDFLAQMGISMPNDNFHQSRDIETLKENLDKCKFHKKGIDDVGRNIEISKTEVDNISIDLHTLSDAEIWEKYLS